MRLISWSHRICLLLNVDCNLVVYYQVLHVKLETEPIYRKIESVCSNCFCKAWTSDWWHNLETYFFPLAPHAPQFICAKILVSSLEIKAQISGCFFFSNLSSLKFKKDINLKLGINLPKCFQLTNFEYQGSPKIWSNPTDPPDPPRDTSRVSDSFCRSSMLPPAARTHLNGKCSIRKLWKLEGQFQGHPKVYFPLKWWLFWVCLISGTLTTFCEFSVWGHPKTMMFLYVFMIFHWQNLNLGRSCSLRPICKNIPEKSAQVARSVQSARLQSQSCSYLEGRSLRFA